MITCVTIMVSSDPQEQLMRHLGGPDLHCMDLGWILGLHWESILGQFGPKFVMLDAEKVVAIRSMFSD